MRRKLARELQQVVARINQVRHLRKQASHVTRRQCTHHVVQRLSRNGSEQVTRGRDIDHSPAKHRELLEGRQRVAHATVSIAHHYLERLVLVGKALLFADVREMGEHVGVANRPEVESLDSTQNGIGNLLRVGRAKDEHHVSWRLLQCLEQRVECLHRQHVDLVDDVHLKGTADGRVVHAADDLLAHRFHASARCRIELIHVRMVTGGDEGALLTGAVGQMASPLLAEQRLGQQSRHGRLARAARPTEQIRMVETPFEHGMLKGVDHVLLPHHTRKGLRSILPIERLHAPSVSFASFALLVYPPTGTEMAWSRSCRMRYFSLIAGTALWSHGCACDFGTKEHVSARYGSKIPGTAKPQPHRAWDI